MSDVLNRTGRIVERSRCDSVLRKAVGYRDDGDPRVETLLEQRAVNAFVPATEAAAVNGNEDRSRLLRFRLPEIKDIALVRSILYVGLGGANPCRLRPIPSTRLNS